MRKVEMEESILSILAASSRKKVATLKLSCREVERMIEDIRKDKRGNNAKESNML